MTKGLGAYLQNCIIYVTNESYKFIISHVYHHESSWTNVYKCIKVIEKNNILTS